MAKDNPQHNSAGFSSQFDNVSGLGRWLSLLDILLWVCVVPVVALLLGQVVIGMYVVLFFLGMGLIFKSYLEKNSIILFFVFFTFGQTVFAGDFNDQPGNVLSTYSKSQNISQQQLLKWYTSKKERPDPSLEISVESVLSQLSSKKNILLVDVRSHSAFDKFRISGSMNIPLHALKAKTFLKERPFILVNEGFNYLILERECLHLHELGFKQVKILKGGLNAWKANGGLIVGDVFAIGNLNRVTASSFFKERNNGGVLAIDVSNFKSKNAQNFIPEAIGLPFDGKGQAFPKKLNTTIKSQKNPSLMSVLIFNTTGENYDRIEQQIRDKDMGNIFFLEGGLQEYERFLYRQALVSQPGERHMKMVEKCRTCP